MTTPPDPERGDDPVLRLRITHITSTMSSPLPSLAHDYVPQRFATAIPPGSLPHHMPVLRIFGTTSHLQKICANIHLCYPYFFVPYPMDSTDPLRPERVVKLCQRFAVSLNHAICLALRQNPSGRGKYGGGTDPKHLHVVSVMLVKGVPFYGYHIGYSYYLKVMLVNPSRMYVALEQLRKPVVLGREWQPHEAHMSHVLQFMCDFDLYGCGWLDLSGGTFRDPLPEGDPYESPPQGPPTTFDAIAVPSSMIYPPALSPPKDTFSPLEIDVLPHQILNRLRLKPRQLHHDFVELLRQPLDPNEKLVPAVAELWEDERRRRAAKGLSLKEEAMMPRSGGMGGRTMDELGYKVEGKETQENRGGDWKISEELWEMLEGRMASERRKKGRTTFERFSMDVTAGKDGEKRKYDRWVMTTFDAVSAHWPERSRPPMPTQRSKRSRRTKASSAVAPSSPLPHFALKSSPLGARTSSPVREPSPLFEIKVEANIGDLPNGQGGALTSDDVDEYSSDEENPFEAIAMSQASFTNDVQAEINPYAITREALQVDEDVEDDEDVDAERQRQRHAEDARQHAADSVRLRATQAPAGGDESEEYDDDELDDLFRNTVLGGFYSPRGTPRRDRANGSATVTPTSAGTSGGGLDERRARREQRLREQAGLGDLSTIFDRSSISLSPRANPYDDTTRTPNKPRTPVSDKATPTSLVRNLFAKNRASVSPLDTPSKRRAWPPANAVVLPPARKATVGWKSPSPEDSAVLIGGPTKETPKANGHNHIKVEIADAEQDVKRDIALHEIMASDERKFDALPPAAQPEPSYHSSKSTTGSNGNVTAKRGPSPTFRDPEPGPTAVDMVADAPVQSSHRPKKRVRLVGPIDEPENPFTQQRQHSQHSQPSQPRASNNSLASSQTAETSETTSTVPSNLSRTAWTFHRQPPSSRDVQGTIESYGEPSVVYQEPFYSNTVDVPPRAKMFGGRMFSIKGSAVADLQEFGSSVPFMSKRWLKTKTSQNGRARYGWEYGLPPPSFDQVVHWCTKQDDEATEQAKRHALLNSQLARPTQKSRFGFKYSQKNKSEAAEREQQNMSVLALEVFAKSRHQLLPDPEKDELTAVFFCFQNEDDGLPDTTTHRGYHAGYVVIDSPQTQGGRARLEGLPCHVVDSELDLINWVIDSVKTWDPDVLAGWELHNASWGYLAARANEAFSIDLTEEISRVVGGRSGPKKDFYSATHTSTFKVSGRHILNIWRICRSEINLNQYSFENVVFHLLRQRIPHYSSASLTALWKSKTPEHAVRVLRYLFTRVVIYCEIVDAAEIITKNAEFARVFGVDFASVMFRGSQFKVESFMFRIAKPESFVLVSPSKQQVGLQNAPFAVPLIAEPESKYYNHPILVLDFQSLYPSVMIAYNICFSTCLGRVEKFKGTDKFGFTELKVADGLLDLLKDYLTVTPNGMIFVKPCVRKSLLAKMLGEILDTRVMVKQAMKSARGDKSLTQLLNARQLGLKLMANVTYGYTSATYSGRMPCIEVADSIVQTGRETLEKAQELIHSRAEWAAQVVYGDTDSLFVALPGRSKEQAFKIGNEIADAVTATNPKPVKLKFEKVYMGSVLMAKKRYVGFKYEHPDETEPVFDAKGIETIRRDGFPAQQKIEEVCLKLLFRTQDLSQIKDFCRQEWTKILQGRVSIQDFVIAKEVRLGSYSEKGVPPPGAAVAYRRILKDPRDEPQYAERVPYIVSNAEGRRLIDRARMPQEMLVNRSLGIDAEYYIRNLLVPPLSRIFNLVGADVEHWYDSMPRTKRVKRYDLRDSGKMRIDSHFKSSHCVVCGIDSNTNICNPCRADPAQSTHALLSREHIAHEKLLATHRICSSCSSTPVHERNLCDSIDCPVLYARVQAQRDVEDVVEARGIVEMLKREGMDGEIDDLRGMGDGEFAGALDW